MSVCQDCGHDHDQIMQDSLNDLAKKIADEIDKQIVKELVEQHEKTVEDNYDRAMKGL